MLHGFEKKYGVQIAYTGTRDADAVLASDLQRRNPPDLAVLATPGELPSGRDGRLLAPLDGTLDRPGRAAHVHQGPGCYLDHEGSFITAFYTQDRLRVVCSGCSPQAEDRLRLHSVPADNILGPGP